MKRKKRKRKPKNCGLGPHHEVSPMGHATKTPSKVEKIRKAERKHKDRDREDSR